MFRRRRRFFLSLFFRHLNSPSLSTSPSSSLPPQPKKKLSWAFFFLFGHIRDAFRNLLPWTRRKLPKGYVPVRQDYEDFYTRRMFYRIHDCWNRPIGSAPDAYVDVLERTPVSGQKALELTGNKIRALNLGSYNYLGFAAHDPYCTPRALETLRKEGWSSCSPRAEAGTTQLHLDLEQELATFLRKPAALCFGMGFATNSAVLPVLAGPGCLIVSDALNHASIVSGARGSGAKVAVFAHNDVDSLESVLRTQVARGQPRTRRPWKKVLVVVEGIYSMEGELAPLPDIVAVCKRYRAYLYLDEAHSIGALGPTGRGVCEALGVDPKDVDVMMGRVFFVFSGSFSFRDFFLNTLKSKPKTEKKNRHLHQVIWRRRRLHRRLERAHRRPEEDRARTPRGDIDVPSGRPTSALCAPGSVWRRWQQARRGETPAFAGQRQLPSQEAS